MRVVEPYRRLFRYLKPHVPVLVFGARLALVVSAMAGLTAWRVKPVMDDILTAGSRRSLPLTEPGAAGCPRRRPRFGLAADLRV